MALKLARTLSDAPARLNHVAAVPAVSLESLPVEILMNVASRLDYWSLLSLDRVSRRCRDAVTIHLGQVRVFSVQEGRELTPHTGWEKLSREQKISLLSRLTALRKLNVQWVAGEDETGQWMLETLLATSTAWSRLETLTVGWVGDGFDRTLLGEFCANCPNLTDITLRCGFAAEVMQVWMHEFDMALFGEPLCVITEEMETMLTARRGPDPTSELIDYCQATGLACCVQLLGASQSGGDSWIDCLPSDGLPSLRHFTLIDQFESATDASLAWLVERQPGLESVCLQCCYIEYPGSLMSSDLTSLGRLPALYSLSIEDIRGVSDWVLDQLSTAPLTELQLGGSTKFGFWESVTAGGLYRLTQTCPELRWATLWDENNPTETTRTTDCRSDAGKRELLRRFEDLVKPGDGSRVPYCRLSAAPPAGKVRGNQRRLPSRWRM